MMEQIMEILSYFFMQTLSVNKNWRFKHTLCTIFRCAAFYDFFLLRGVDELGPETLDQSIPLMLCEIPLAQLPFSQSHFNPLYPSYHSNNTHNILCPSTLCAPNEI